MPNIYQAPQRFPLDVAGTIYPSARTRSWNYTFRIGFLLREEADHWRLRRALVDLRPRFPSFFVSARHGLFWYYLERVEGLDIVRKETDYPCRPMDIFSRCTPAIRVLYDRRRVSLEISHAISDAGGALVFAKALLARYLELGGVEIPPGSGLPDLSEPPRPGELEDSYRAHYTKEREKPRGNGPAYQYRPPRIRNYLKVIHGVVPLENILPIVKARDMTVTDYLMAVYLYSFYAADPRARHSRRPIKISISVSLRGLYQSESLRNFSLYANLGFTPREEEIFAFEDILEAIKGKLAAAKTKEEMHKLLCSHVALVKNPFVRAVPNAIKRRIMRLGYILEGENTQTSPLSSLGWIKLPPCIAAHVESVEVILGGSPYKHIQCAAISDDRMLHLFFSGDTEKTDVQREFFRLLAREGICARVESNIRSEEASS